MAELFNVEFARSLNLFRSTNKLTGSADILLFLGDNLSTELF